ncbi:MAG: sigma 54-interacting transcriptional regulator [Planctomycetes bacterium]|nr:sigma 54-interacting transcriptional regulator [Planctomycetota bacterium]
MPFLVVEEKNGTRQFPIRGNSVSFGRSPENDVMLADEKSSRKHCTLTLENGQFILRDLKSLNGTLVRGERVLEQRLEIGDFFQIGQAKIRLQNEDSSAFETQGAMEPISANAAPLAGHQAVGINEALGSLAYAVAEDTPKSFVEAAAQFIGRLIPGLRVCICIANTDGALEPKAFFNFISGSPQDELPAFFRATANRLLANKAKTQVKARSGDYPPCVFVPLRCGERVQGVMYVERENKDTDISETQVKLIENASLLAGTLMGASVSRSREDTMGEKIEDLEDQLAQLRKEMEAKLDLQTAELTNMKKEAEDAEAPQHRFDYSEMIGNSQGMHEVFRMLDKVTDLPVPVLILGESGSGKELVARALHFNSGRAASGKLVAENCAALPETLLESELFGYMKGAFTGADRDKIGMFGLANGGTIFLDEIGEISLAMQAKLLRVIEEGEVRPIGAKASKKVDFRLVCATNKNLAEEVRKGTFRQDLFFRINVVTIRLPPLRERKEDIPLLVDFFLKKAASDAGYGHVKLDRGVLRALMSYSWPGNVRELENEIKRLVALSDGKKVEASLLSPGLRQVAEEESLSEIGSSLKDVVENIEKRKIVEAMDRTKGNKSRAAELLGLSRLGLRKKMERYGIEGDKD